MLTWVAKGLRRDSEYESKLCMKLPVRYRLSDAEKDALLSEQAALIERMAARIAELEAAAGKPKKTSSNSHTPPSKDGPGRENR